jgi:hypothetical protein
MFGNTSSSSALTYGSLCGIYYRIFLPTDLVKEFSPMESIILDPVLSSISPNSRGWMKAFFIYVLMIGSSLYSNCFAAPGEEPLPTSRYFSFGALDDRLVVRFLGGIVPVIKINFRDYVKNKTR